MSKIAGGIVVIGLCLWSQGRGPIVGPLEESGFKAIFNGKSMSGGMAIPGSGAWKRRPGRSDYRGEAARAEYVSHLARRKASRLRVEVQLQVDGI